MTAKVTIDPAACRMSIGELALAIDLHPADGSVQVLPPSGPIVRPVTFGERYRLVELASSSADPSATLRGALLRCATVEGSAIELSAAEHAACEALALHLAGAGIDAPSFSDAMLLLASGAGWLYHQIEEAEASRVDRLAARMRPVPIDEDDGWNRVLFAPPAPDGVDDVARELAMGLLGRLDMPPAPVTIEPPRAATWHAPSRGDRFDDRREDEEMPARSATPLEPAAESFDEARSEGPSDEGTRRLRLLGYRLDASRGKEGSRASAERGVRGRDSDDERSGVRLLRGSFGARRDASPEGSVMIDSGSPGSQVKSTSPGSELSSRSDRRSSSPSSSIPTSSGRGDAGSMGMREIAGGGVSASDARGGVRDAIASSDHIAARAGVRSWEFSSPMLEPEPGWPSDELATHGARVAEAPLPETGAPSDLQGILPRALATSEGGIMAATGQGVEMSLMEIADALAELLNDEADLRGLDR